jgi:3-dehydroquinate synthetase
MGEEMGISRAGLSEEISAVLAGIGLPIQVPAGFEQSTIEKAIFRDKKRAGESVKFAIPVDIGQARFGISLTLDDLRRSHAFHSCFTRT